MDLYDYDARISYLRLVAFDVALEEVREKRPRTHVSEIDVTQIGKTGFYFKPMGQVIPEFRPWPDRIAGENERFF